MSAADRPRASAAAFAQLGLAFGCVLLVGAQFWAGLAALVALGCAWPPQVALRPLAARRVLLAYLPFAVGWLAFVVAYLRVLHALGQPLSPQGPLQQLAEHGTGLDGFALLVFGIVVVAPVLEEVVFRGYLFTALATVLPMWAVQAVTALLFGLVHGLAYALPIAVLALLFGWLRQRHRALGPPILAHAVHNGITVLLAILWPAHLDLLYPR